MVSNGNKGTGKAATKAAAARYEAELPRYEAFCDHIVELLSSTLEAAGVRCRVFGRVKTPQSLIKKMLLKRRAYDEVRDKAGVRVVLNYPGDRPMAEQLVRDCMVVHTWEDKARGLSADRIGYRGLHFDAQLDDPRFEGMYCEIQIHRPGEALWAGLAHDLIYKAPVDLPVEVRRKLNRLIVLAEIIDDEATNVRETFLELSNRPAARALSEAKALLDPAMHHTQLSMVILEQLASVGLVDAETPSALQTFSAAQRDRIDRVLAEQEGSWNPVFEEPAVLVLFMLIDADEHGLMRHPPEVLTAQILRDVVAAWQRDHAGAAPPDPGQ